MLERINSVIVFAPCSLKTVVIRMRTTPYVSEVMFNRMCAMGS